jgi:ABC-type branched-subunit amino acid transport system ATPase component
VSTSEILRVTNVVVRFGGLTAVDIEELTVRRGAIVGIIGANGAGKTTLFDVISGFVSPNRGSVLFEGQHELVGRAPERRARLGLGRSFQNAVLFGSMTVAETLAVAFHRQARRAGGISAVLGIRRRAEARLQESVDEVVELMGLQDYYDSFISELSTGTRRVVDLACVLAHKPTLLLLDEPSAGVAGLHVRRHRARHPVDPLALRRAVRDGGRQGDRPRDARRGARRSGRDRGVPGHGRDRDRPVGRGRRRLVKLRLAGIAVLLAVASALASGCGLQLRAEQLEVDVSDGTMRLIKPLDGKFRGGEVVITIMNNTDARRQFTLAETGAAPANLPGDIVNAYSYRDESKVVAVTGVMRPAEIELIFGAIPQAQPTVSRLHVYMHPGRPYLLFDRLGGYRQGIALRLQAEDN